MFEITTFELPKKGGGEWELPYDYYCLYILENGKDAYIGYTNKAVRRTVEHTGNSKKSKKKYHFKRVHVITGLLAEATPMMHYENLLIKLMREDGKFHVINGDDGIEQHYYRKNEFELYFDDLWVELEKKGLVNTKKFEFILDADRYKYFPDMKLTEEQAATLTSIVHTLDSGELKPFSKKYKARPILIKGEAGKGKTALAASLFYYLKHQERYKGKKIGMIYTDKAARIRIREAFRHYPDIDKIDVLSPAEAAKEHYDIVICDEAEKLTRVQGPDFDTAHDGLDCILDNSTYQIMFYDEMQITGSCNLAEESLEARLIRDKRRGLRPVELKEQVRI